MNSNARFAIGLLLCGAGLSAAAGLAGTGAAQAAPDVCGALPGQSSTMTTCSAKAGPDAIGLAISDGGGIAWSQGDGLSGPAAIAIGPGASVQATGIRPGLSIGIAGPGAHVVIDGRKGPVCSGKGFAFAGDFQTLRGCRQ
ncbi:hypothetical protein [Gordonia sp. FQ]|uniref:hypothetical protein n=1 Tax=Gordonia sp. FQ TaxID=3446634 RepID=UPI003F85B743